jgi:membrane protein YqaA with SNARE-associated domain
MSGPLDEPGSLPELDPPRAAAPSVLKLVLRVGAGLLVLLLAVALLARLFRTQLETMGHGFVDRFGLLGMAFGSLLADGFCCPIPPQFYMLMGVTSRVPAPLTLLAVNLGSFVGAWCGYLLSHRVSHFGPLARRLVQARGLSESVLARYGTWSVVVASFLPIPYSILCYLSGLSRLPRRGFALISIIRVPRLIGYYYLVQLGWLSG